MLNNRKTGICLIVVIVVLVGILYYQAVEIENLQAELVENASFVTPAVSGHGKYTIFHYPEGGLITPVYITDYYLVGQVVHYIEKGSKEYKPIWLPYVRFADGWIEDEEQLMKNGVWFPDDLGL